MAYLSLVLLSLACFAGDVVDLEPVFAYTDNFLCSKYTASGSCQTDPVAIAYCVFNSTDCVDDPQLRVLAEGDDGPSGSCSIQKEGVTGAVLDLTDYLDADCKEPKGTGKICAKSTGKSASDFNYCIYAWLRDGVCPDSICVRDTSTNDPVKNKCVPSNVQQCTMLSEKDCKLVPKCYWKSGCLQDPCFKGSADKTCSTWPGADPDPTKAVPLGDCVDFKPLRTGTTDIQLYCLHKNNTNPNICYFAGKNDSTTDLDYGITYPTFVDGIKYPTCTGQISTCDGTGTCYTTINTGGALAGQYCTDGTHGSANILRIPSMLVFLVVSALSLFIL